MTHEPNLVDVTDFRSVSMRGRVAFALACLEQAILQQVPRPNEWLPILDQLWRYTRDTDLDTWQEYMAEQTPSVILEDETYVSGDFDHVSSSQFYALRALYSSHDQMLSRLVDLIFELGTLDIFGALGEAGEESLGKLQDIVTLMTEHAVIMPSIDLVSQYSFDVASGWGAPFDPSHLRRIGNRT